MSYSRALSKLFGTQARAAEAAGVTQPRVCRWVDAIPADRAIALVRNAPKFGVDPDEVAKIVGPCIWGPAKTLDDALRVARAAYQAKDEAA